MRRIEALTGEAARLWLTARDEQLREAAAALKASPDEVPARVAALVEERRRLERELAEAKKALALGGGGAAAPAGPEQVGGVEFLGQVVDGLDPKGLRGAGRRDQAAARHRASRCWSRSTRAAPSVAVGVTDDLVGTLQRGRSASSAAVAALGGQGGGGRPDMAQGGGPDGDKADDAVAAVRAALEQGASA